MYFLCAKGALQFSITIDKASNDQYIIKLKKLYGDD